MQIHKGIRAALSPPRRGGAASAAASAPAVGAAAQQRSAARIAALEAKVAELRGPARKRRRASGADDDGGVGVGGGATALVVTPRADISGSSSGSGSGSRTKSREEVSRLKGDVEALQALLVGFTRPWRYCTPVSCVMASPELSLRPARLFRVSAQRCDFAWAFLKKCAFASWAAACVH